MEGEIVLVGSYTQSIPHEPEASGPGILTLLATENKVSAISGCRDDICGPNPSYLASNERNDIFAVNEVESGTITRLRLQDDLSLSFNERIECGKLPCHIATVANGVVAACFGDGSLWSYEFSDGEMKVADMLVPSRAYESLKSGLHQVLVVKDTLLIACDPLANTVSLISRDECGKLQFRTSIYLKGDYPRHSVQFGERIYVSCAKSRCIVELQVRNSDGEMRLIETSRLRLGQGSGSLGAIRVSGSTIVVTERGNGCNRLWTLAIGKKGETNCRPSNTGGLSGSVSVGVYESGGNTPRDANIGNEIIVVTHQSCGTIAVASKEKVLSGNGKMRFKEFRFSGKHGAPVCALFVPSTSEKDVTRE